MPLVECSSCGKKISNTTNNCIHCGAPVFSTRKSNKDICVNGIPLFEKPTHEREIISFNSLSEQEQFQLENEFLKQNELAMTVRSKYVESKKMNKLVANVFLYFVGPLNVALFLARMSRLHIYQRQSLWICFIGILVLVAFLSIISIGNAFYLKTYKKSKKRFTYINCFRKWLRENKNIECTLELLSPEEEKALRQIENEKNNL